MAKYHELVEYVMERGVLTITAPVTYSSIRRGINKVIDEVNKDAEILETPTFAGDIVIKELRREGLLYTYKLTYMPQGRELPDCFKPRFEFEIVTPEENSNATEEELRGCLVNAEVSQDDQD